MRPEDRLARLLAALDRLPRGARRALTVLLPVALLGALLASLAFAPRPGHDATEPATSEAPSRRATSPTSPEGPNPTPPVGADVGGPPVEAAAAAAPAFIESYVAFSYGRGGLRAIRAADPALVRTFADQRVTPAQRKRRPRVTALRVVRFSPGVARATAVIADGQVRYPLVFFLDRRGRGWLVTQMAD